MGASSTVSELQCTLDHTAELFSRYSSADVVVDAGAEFRGLELPRQPNDSTDMCMMLSSREYVVTPEINTKYESTP